MVPQAQETMSENSSSSTVDLNGNRKVLPANAKNNNDGKKQLNCARASVMVYLLAAAAVLGGLSHAFVIRQGDGDDADSSIGSSGSFAEKVSTIRIINNSNTLL